MTYTVVYDPMHDWYKITLNMEVEGIPITTEFHLTSEILVSHKSEIIEYEAEHMMMSVMKLAAEALMPQAIKQINKGIQEASKNPGKPYPHSAFISTSGVKSGQQVTNIVDPGEMDWDIQVNGAKFIRNILGKYVDLNQEVDLPKEVWSEWGVEDEQSEFYHSVTNISLEDAIIALNDGAGWSYEQIADWLETLDVNIAINLEGGE